MNFMFSLKYSVKDMKGKKGSTNQRRGQSKIQFLVFCVESSCRNHESPHLQKYRLPR